MTKRTVKIFSWNVNGLRSVARKGFLEWMSRVSPDILCLQETKAHPAQVEEIVQATGAYGHYWNNPERKGYAGVGIFTREKPVLVKKEFSPGPFDTEGRYLQVDLGDFTLINVYFPNGRMNKRRLEYKMAFYGEFLKHARKLRKGNVIICGDVNTAHTEIDLARPRQNSMFSGFLPEERQWIDRLIGSGYTDIFRTFDKSPGKYTWWDMKSRSRERNVGWRIDYFFVSSAMVPRVTAAYLMPEVTGSDHCPIGIDIKHQIRGEGE